MALKFSLGFFFCWCFALLHFTARVEALYGPITPTDTSEYPFLVAINHTGFNFHFASAIISRRYVITSPFFNDANKAQYFAYSGNIKSKSSKHVVTKVLTNSYASILKLCPHIASVYKPISLDNMHDFSQNASGKVIFIKRSTSEVFTRTTTVLTDPACVAENVAGHPNQAPWSTFNSNHACTVYDNSAGSCEHMRENGGWSSLPMLLVDDKPVGALRDARCSNLGTMVSIGNFNKFNTNLAFIKDTLKNVP